MRREPVFIVLIIIIAILLVPSSIAADNIYYTEARLLDLRGSTGYIVNFTLLDTDSNVDLVYYNGSTHTFNISQYDIYSVTGSTSFTKEFSTSSVKKLLVMIKLNTVNYYITTTIYLNQYNGSVSTNRTVTISFPSTNILEVNYGSGMAKYNVSVASGDYVEITLTPYTNYISITHNGNTYDLNVGETYCNIWKIDKGGYGPPPNPDDEYMFKVNTGNTKYINDGVIIASNTDSIQLIYNGTHLVFPGGNINVGIISYVNSTALLGIYYYLEPQTTTVTSTVTQTQTVTSIQTVTSTETQTVTSTQTVTDTVTVTNTSTVTESKYYTFTQILNHTVTKYIGSTYNNNWIIPGVIVFILLIILGLGLAASTGKHRR